jgi:ribulose-bisphosphate carboxylase large chain
LQTLREANLKLGIHGHRAMHAAFTRNKRHGIRMIVLADFCRLIGIDSLHIGTGIGKLEGDIREIHELEEEMEYNKVRETQLRLLQNWHGVKPTLAVCSGGLHPRHVPFLIRHLGRDISIQMGGGIHGHPDGTRIGAIAARQAIDAALQHISLDKYAEDYPELRDALDFWAK